MAIPDYQSLMSPVLSLMADKGTRKVDDILALLAKQLVWTNEQLSEMLPSGSKTIAKDRVSWTVTYLTKAGLLLRPKTATYTISEEGIKVAKLTDVTVNNQFLLRYPEFAEFYRRKNRDRSGVTLTLTSRKKRSKVDVDTFLLSPDEQLDSAALSLQQVLEDDLLDKLKTVSPSFFERIVVDLLVAMGYGGSVKDAGKTIGKSGDGGVDGIIKEDKLGLDTIYIQAKRWEANVGRPEIQKFAGALQGFRAKKGVFITTSSYSNDAMDYVKNIDSKIVLIDGAELSRLMIEYGVGVGVQRVVKVMRIDGDYFEE